MDVEGFREYCLAKKGVTEEFPFDSETLVFKVMGKIFALCGLQLVPFRISLKCDPEWAITLREDHDGIITGAYHMNKTHWNSVLPQKLPLDLVKNLIDHSYEQVVTRLPRYKQIELQNLDPT